MCRLAQLLCSIAVIKHCLAAIKSELESPETVSANGYCFLFWRHELGCKINASDQYSYRKRSLVGFYVILFSSIILKLNYVSAVNPYTLKGIQKSGVSYE